MSCVCAIGSVGSLALVNLDPVIPVGSGLGAGRPPVVGGPVLPPT